MCLWLWAILKSHPHNHYLLCLHQCCNVALNKTLSIKAYVPPLFHLSSFFLFLLCPSPSLLTTNWLKYDISLKNVFFLSLTMLHVKKWFPGGGVSGSRAQVVLEKVLEGSLSTVLKSYQAEATKSLCLYAWLSEQTMLLVSTNHWQ